MKMYGPVRITRSENELRLVAGPNWLALLPTFILAGVFATGVYFVLRAAQVSTTGDATGEYVFAGLLSAGAIGALAMAVVRCRRRITLAIRNTELSCKIRGLTTKAVNWQRGASEYLIVATHETHSSTDKGNRVRRTYSLFAADDESGRRELVCSSDERTVKTLAEELAREMGNVSIETTKFSDADREQEVLDRLHVDRLKRERDQALNEMRSAANELEEQATQIRSEALKDKKSSGEELRQVDLAKQVAQSAASEVQLAEFEARAQDFAQYEFTSVLPGQIVEFARLTRPAEVTFRAILFRSSTMGVAVLLLIVAPVLMALFGTLLVAVVDLLPSSDTESRTRQAVVDMFAFGLGSFLWIPVFLAIYTAWTFLKVDAAFSQYRVRIDWQQQEVAIEKADGSTRTIPFHSIQALSTSVAKSWRSKESSYKHAVQLSVKTNQGSSVPLIDDILMSSEASPTNAAEYLEPVASQLAEAMGVPLHRNGPSQSFDSGGFPFRPSVFRCSRIWHLASSRARLTMLTTMCAAITFSILLFCFRYLSQHS